MSKTVDVERAKHLEVERLFRLEKVLTDLARVTRLQREGMSMDDIAARLGWSRATLYNWLQAAKVLQRRGIRMAEGRTNP